MASRESLGGGEQTACGPARDAGDTPTPAPAGLGLALSVQSASGVRRGWETGMSQGGVPANQAAGRANATRLGDRHHVGGQWVLTPSPTCHGLGKAPGG